MDRDQYVEACVNSNQLDEIYKLMFLLNEDESYSKDQKADIFTYALKYKYDLLSSEYRDSVNMLMDAWSNPDKYKAQGTDPQELERDHRAKYKYLYDMRPDYIENIDKLFGLDELVVDL